MSTFDFKKSAKANTTAVSPTTGELLIWKV